MRYFKVIEIEADEFIEATGEVPNCCQSVVPTEETVFVAADEDTEYEFSVPIDSFDK